MVKPLGSLLICVCLAGASWPARHAEDEGRLLIRRVTASDRYIVFSYAGDLWRLGRDGGEAQRLTDGPAEDDFPAFSPDGTWVAFSRRGADDWDVYVTNVLGGRTRRLTYNPEADIVRGWSPDGANVLFMSHRDEELTFRLYTIPSPRGAFPTALPLPRGWEGSFSPDGRRIAYVPIALPSSLLGAEWRYYRGGMTSPIWIAELKHSEIERIPRENSNDRYPMWVGDRIYFVSDRSGTFNLHVYDPQTQAIEQLTTYDVYGIRHAAAGGGTIVFLQDGHIRVFDPHTRETRTLEIRIDPDSSELAPRTVNGEGWIQSAAPSADGERVAFGVRGDVVILEPDSGEARNLTLTPGAAERYPVLSPDGRWVAYFSDESGEYELRVRPASGEGRVRTIPIELRSSFYKELVWSPDSKRLAFSDKRLALWVADIETGGARRIATSSYSDQDAYHPSWSPDGVWLAYSKYEENRLRAIYLYHVLRGRKRRITDGRTHAEHPVFDRSGKYLYFLASNTSALGEFGWSVLSGVLYRPLVSRRLNVVVLRDDLPAPVLPVIGTTNPAADSVVPAPKPPRGRRTARRSGGPPPGGRAGHQGGPRTLIHLRGIGDRIVQLPLPAKDYAGLAAGQPGVLYVLVNEWPDSPAPGNPPSKALYRFDLSRPSELVKLIDEVSEFSVSSDGSHILYRSGDDWSLVAAATPQAPEAGRLDLTPLRIEVDPAAEWRQIYHEAWRLMRDYFYDPSYHGQNLSELEQHYGTYMPSVTRRRDLNLLLGRALGHLSVSHLGVSGGDLPRPSGSGGRIGLLGADYEIDGGRYRITRIYRSGHYNDPNRLLRAPLDQPGVKVLEGEYLLAVDGQPIVARKNLYSYFEGTALRPVKIEVGPDPEGKDSRTYTVVPVPGENTLRRMNWAERNRRLVQEKTNGVLAYVYVPNFDWGLESVFRQLLGSTDRRGLVIDERFAGGGVTSDYLIELLSRTPLYYYAFRQGDDLAVPTNPMPAAKVLLINDADASAAETFAFMFKLAKVGKVVGTRTWGAGIGPYASIPELIDGGRVDIPNRAAYDPAGSWAIENWGIEPDIAVEWLPADWRQGRDPQLEAAMKAALQYIVDNPPLEVKRPDYPVRP